MHALEAHIEQAEQIIDRVHREEQARSELIELRDVIEEDPYRSLRTELRDIEQLAAKIKERGQLVPILVWLRRGQYVLLSGHRRTAALRALGATTIKAIVYSDRELSQKDALDIAIDDNVDRNNFSRVELGVLVHRLVQEGLTQRKVAKRLRLSTGSVSDYYRLNTAPADVKAAIDTGRLALRAGLLLQSEAEATRAEVLSHGDSGMLSLGDVTRLLAADDQPAPAATKSDAPAPPPRAKARRGAAWSRRQALLAGLAWQRQRNGERELQVRIPAEPTDEQKQQLRKLLLDQVRGL